MVSAKQESLIQSFSLVKFEQFEPKTGSACILKNLENLGNTLIDSVKHLHEIASGANLQNDMQHKFCEFVKYEKLNEHIEKYWKLKKKTGSAPKFKFIDSSLRARLVS